MPRADLVPDCAACAAVCCVATSFDAGPDFAIDKPHGVPCVHLAASHRCTIHDALDARGFRGCAAYDCHGAGPRVTREHADVRTRGAAFHVLRVVHELLWLAIGAAELAPSASLRAELDAHVATLDDAAATPFATIDVEALERQTHVLLRRVGDALGGRTPRRLPIARY